MKLLLDENLSFRLTAMLADLYPQSRHVRDAGLTGASDEQVWGYALQHNFIIASKDFDFYQRSILMGAPPKIIWLRIGNGSTAQIERLIRSRHSVILRLVEDTESSFLVLGGAEHKSPDSA